jgi:hypothetical protein
MKKFLVFTLFGSVLAATPLAAQNTATGKSKRINKTSGTAMRSRRRATAS